MKVTIQDVEKIMTRFATVFQFYMPSVPPDFYQVWFDSLREFDAVDVHEACRRLICKMRNFPLPADVVAELGAMVKTMPQ